MTAPRSPKDVSILAFCGGVGGAKLALGLYKLLGSDLCIAVNTGDDFEHLGLTICPDVDTVCYTLAELSDLERGWGRANETWNFMAALEDLGGETWFQLGDRDLAIHIERTRRINEGQSLSEILAFFRQRLGISCSILPMSDDRVRTIVSTDEGDLEFQRYFVGRRCEPRTMSMRFDGADDAKPAAALIEVLANQSLKAIIICPSNPFLSIDPILAIPSMRDLLKKPGIPIVAVSPIIGGRAVKGPTTKIMSELGIPLTTSAIADHYRGLIDGWVLHESDRHEADVLGAPTLVTNTFMRTLDDRIRLASDVLEFSRTLRGCSKA